jgi:hypothetical protein
VKRERLPVAMLVCFVLGAGLMVPFNTVLTRTLGVLLLFAFVGLGLVAIAGPGASTLQDEPDEHA